MSHQLKQGAGWRLGWNPQAPLFQGLVGSNDWALELTEAEFNDFCRLALDLDRTMQSMRQELMAEERIQCEVESPLIWLEADGFPGHYDLHLMILTGRRGDGMWPAIAVAELIPAIQTLKVF